MIACGHFCIFTPAAVLDKPLAPDLPVLFTRSEKLYSNGQTG
jgi:hypothetical protein